MNQTSNITPAELAVDRQTVIPDILMDILIVLYVTTLIAGSQVMIVKDRKNQLCYKVHLLN